MPGTTEGIRTKGIAPTTADRTDPKNQNLKLRGLGAVRTNGRGHYLGKYASPREPPKVPSHSSRAAWRD
jgi:hypothetical protein